MVRILQYCILIPIFLWNVALKVFKNFFSLWYIVSIIVLWCLGWPPFSFDLSWFSIWMYVIFFCQTLYGIFLTILDLPLYFCVFMRIILQGGTIMELIYSYEFLSAFFPKRLKYASRSLDDMMEDVEEVFSRIEARDAMEKTRKELESIEVKLNNQISSLNKKLNEKKADHE